MSGAAVQVDAPISGHVRPGCAFCCLGRALALCEGAMLIADRFMTLAGVTIDLASGRRADLQMMPALSGAEHADWVSRCGESGDESAAPPTRRLIDYGVLDTDSRFEAYLLDASPVVPAVNARAVTPMLSQIDDALSTARLGEPRCLRIWNRATPPPPSVLDAIARRARLQGFVPLALELAVAAASPPAAVSRSSPDLAVELANVLRTRHVLLISTRALACTGCANGDRRQDNHAGTCPAALARLIVGIAANNARPTTVLIPAAAPQRRAHPCCGWRRPRGVATIAGRREPAASMATKQHAAEAHEPYRVSTPDVVRLRARAAETLGQATGRGAERTECGLRNLAGALARRDDSAGAAWLNVNIGCLMLERGRALDAARAFETARGQFDRVRDTHGAVRATVYLGLAWTDDGRFSEAGAALRAARIAAQEMRARELEAEAGIALARCLYWQGRFDEASVLVSTLLDEARRTDGIVPAKSDQEVPYGDTSVESAASVAREGQASDVWGGDRRLLDVPHRGFPVADPDRGVRLSALAARVALATGDLRAATSHGTSAVEAANGTGRPVDACTAHSALAAVYAALKDAASVARHVSLGIGAARRAHAPLRALRLRLIAADALRHAGREADARRALRRLATLRGDRFPALVRSRLEIVLGREPGDCTPAPSGRPRASIQIVASACPWRLPARRTDLVDDIVSVLQVCHDIEDEERALGHLCEALRDRTRAVAVAILGRDNAAPAMIAHAGCTAGHLAIGERVIDTGVAVSGISTAFGFEAAAPIRYAGATIGTVFGRWPADALVDWRRVAGLLSAASAGAAPQVRSLLDRQRSPAGASTPDEMDLLGESAGVVSLRKAIRRAAAAPFPVLIDGESGSGKELVARAIHRESARRARRFSALNCAALTDELIEAELFGYARGAFTGAVTERVGLFEEADGGTLFLDEVGDLSARAQAKLLRALQEGEIRRLGENHARSVDVRVVAATNRDLEREVEEGRFRRDLFYRLHVVHLRVPPLRDRPEDIALLATHFWQRAAGRTGSRATLTPATLAALARYDWPGNVRELQNVMAALVVSAPHRGSVGPGCLPAAIARVEAAGATLETARRTFERAFVRAALARAGGHRSRAASALGVSRQGLAKLMARLDLADDPQNTQTS